MPSTQISRISLLNFILHKPKGCEITSLYYWLCVAVRSGVGFCYEQKYQRRGNNIICIRVCSLIHHLVGQFDFFSLLMLVQSRYRAKALSLPVLSLLGPFTSGLVVWLAAAELKKRQPIRHRYELIDFIPRRVSEASSHLSLPHSSSKSCRRRVETSS